MGPWMGSLDWDLRCWDGGTKHHLRAEARQGPVKGYPNSSSIDGFAVPSFSVPSVDFKEKMFFFKEKYEFVQFRL